MKSRNLDDVIYLTCCLSDNKKREEQLNRLSRTIPTLIAWSKWDKAEHKKRYQDVDYSNSLKSLSVDFQFCVISSTSRYNFDKPLEYVLCQLVKGTSIEFKLI